MKKYILDGGSVICISFIAFALLASTAIAHESATVHEHGTVAATPVDPMQSNGDVNSVTPYGQFNRGTKSHDDWWCSNYESENVCVADKQIGCAWSVEANKCVPTPREW